MVVASPIAVDEVNSYKKTRRGRGKGSKSSAINGMEAGLLATDRSLEPLAPSNTIITNGGDDDDAIMIDITASKESIPMDTADFAPLKPSKSSSGSSNNEIRRIPIPPHRMTPLKRDWVNIFSPLTEMCELQVRMNVPKRQVEIKVRCVRK